MGGANQDPDDPYAGGYTEVEDETVVESDANEPAQASGYGPAGGYAQEGSIPSINDPAPRDDRSGGASGDTGDGT
jgi:hypothetical protein